MDIHRVIWLESVLDKIQWKHQVNADEVEEVLQSEPYFLFKEKGKHYSRENVYVALGQTDAGRFLFVLFIYKVNRNVLVLTARDMTKSERKLYERRKK